MQYTNNESILLAGSKRAISPLGLGTWAWGDKATWGMDGYDSSYGVHTIREAYACSIAAGVTLIDTAEVYGSGESERIIGRLLREDDALRESAVIATKFMPLPWKLSVGTALATSLRASLKRLQLSSVSLYQIHGPTSLRSHRAMAQALATPYHEGLIGSVGVSNYSEKELRSIHAELSQLDVPLATNQVEYSLLRKVPETSGLLDACRELGVAVMAYSPLGQGRLTGKYTAANPPKGRRGFSDYPMTEIDPLVSLLRETGKRYGDKSPGQVALNWVMRKGAIPIPGAKNREQAEQNAGALGWQLSADDVRALDAQSKPGRRSIKHRIWQHG
jgi:aryl-alcohol dehydrogenase-like predicted oxidoreductase